PSSTRARERWPGGGWSIGSAGRSGKSCRSAPKSTRGPTAACTGNSTSWGFWMPRTPSCRATPTSCGSMRPASTRRASPAEGRGGGGRVGWYVVGIGDRGQARSVSAAIDAQFANSADETKTQPEKEFAIGFARQVGDIGALVTRVLVAVFITILLVTGNTMAQ